MRPSTLYAGLPVAGLSVAAVLIVILANQKQTLSARVRDLEARIRDPYPGFLVPPVPATTLAGDSVTVGGAASVGGMQLLLAFHPECRVCVQSLPAWRSLHEAFDDYGHVQVIGISVDSVRATQTFVAEQQIGFPVVSFADRRLQALYRLRLIPQVLLVDAFGRVLYARPGALVDGVAVDSVMAAVAAAASTSSSLVTTPDPTQRRES